MAAPEWLYLFDSKNIEKMADIIRTGGPDAANELEVLYSAATAYAMDWVCPGAHTPTMEADEAEVAFDAICKLSHLLRDIIDALKAHPFSYHRDEYAQKFKDTYVRFVVAASSHKQRRARILIGCEPKKHESGNVFDRVVSWPKLLADNELSSAEEFWRDLDETDHVILLHDHLSKLLVAEGIDSSSFTHDVETPIRLIYLVELHLVLDRACLLIRKDELNWPDELRDGFIRVSEIVAAHAERLSEHLRRKSVAAKGSRGRGNRKTDWKDEAIKSFDPGPEAGSKSHRSRIIRKRAIENGFKDAEKLPKRLDKYLS